MAASYLEPIQRELDDNAIPLSGAKLRFYVNNTTTPMTVYSNAALTIAISQPIVSDAEGWYARVFIPQGIYRRTRHTPDDVLIDSKDDIDTGLSSGAGALGVSSGGTGATTAAGARTSLGVPAIAVTDSLDTRTSDIETKLSVPPIDILEVDAYGATLAPNYSANANRSVTLTGNIVFGVPVFMAGQMFSQTIIQDGTGGRLAVWNAAFQFNGGSPPPLSKTPGAVDVFYFIARTSSIAECISVKLRDPRALPGPDVIIEDRKASGTAGGTATSGADQVRTMNTEVSDRLNIVALSSNQVTISDAGTYYFEWECPASKTEAHQSLLYNVTGAAVVARGTSQIAPVAENTVSVSTGSSFHAITDPTTYEVRHRVSTTAATTGFGRSSSFGTEIYSRLKIWKVA